MRGISQKQFWNYMRNLSAVGAIVMFTFAFVSAQTDLTQLPVGENLSEAPQVGAVWACQTSFQQGMAGAQVQGSWFNDDGTFDTTAKAIVDGQNTWDSEFSITLDGEQRLIAGNGLPSSVTGNYPTASSDDAYQYDRNPHSITEQNISYILATNPTIADESSCLDMGAIGIMINGTVFFNALDSSGRDAGAWETLDGCAGHPESTGEYHHHDLPDCVVEIGGDTGEGHSPLVGYALDGFGLYGHRSEDGETMTNETLDECHGHTHVVEWDGEMIEIYHYHATYEYPYTLGCYRGTPVVTQQMGGQQQQRGTGQQPPQPGNGNGPQPGDGNGPQPGDGNGPGGGNPPPKPGGGG